MTEYLAALVRYAQFERTPDGACLATFPPRFPFHATVYAHANTLEACALAIESVLESYVLWAMQTGQLLPEIDGIAPPARELRDALAQ